MSQSTSEGTESENKEVKRGNKHFSEIQINKLTSRYNPAQNWFELCQILCEVTKVRISSIVVALLCFCVHCSSV